MVNELNPRGVFSFHATALVDLSQLAEVIDHRYTWKTDHGVVPSLRSPKKQ